MKTNWFFVLQGYEDENRTNYTEIKKGQNEMEETDGMEFIFK
ncbi:hypothetical protein [Candidatus Azobacteroides pseudotrichonymphae]|nr:hypothetical protein [Candidatus Azobacteroides pseudotrichonymphae]